MMTLTGLRTRPAVAVFGRRPSDAILFLQHSLSATRQCWFNAGMARSSSEETIEFIAIDDFQKIL